jgi:hypothetical protein
LAAKDGHVAIGYDEGISEISYGYGGPAEEQERTAYED